MVGSGVFGILAEYEDQNDHNALRSDPRCRDLNIPKFFRGDAAFANPAPVQSLEHVTHLYIMQQRELLAHHVLAEREFSGPVFEGKRPINTSNPLPTSGYFHCQSNGAEAVLYPNRHRHSSKLEGPSWDCLGVERYIPTMK